MESSLPSGARPLARKLLAGLILGFVVLLAVMLAGDVSAVGRQVFSFRWALYPAVLALTLFNYTLRFYKWHYYIKQVGSDLRVGPEDDLRVGPEDDLRAGPGDDLRAGPGDDLRAGPGDDLRVGPEDDLRAGPGDDLRVGPEDDLRAGPEDDLRAGPEDDLRAGPGDNLHAGPGGHTGPPLRIASYPLRCSARLFVGGFPLAVTPGKVGEVLKAVWLQRETGVPVPTGIAVVVAERISDGLAVLALSTLGVIAYPQYWPGFVLVGGLLLGIIIVSQIRPLAHRLLDLSARLPLVGRFAPRLREFYEGSFAVFRPRATLTAVALGAVSWLGEGIGFYLILLGLGVPPSWQAASTAVFILAFSTVVGAASTLPGGLGAAEASIAGMLVVLLGLPADTAAAATLLIRFATLWFGISLGLAVWAASPDLLGITDG